MELFDQNGRPRGVLQDVNGDSLVDLVIGAGNNNHPETHFVFLNTGAGWCCVNNTSPDGETCATVPQPVPVCSTVP